VNALDDHDLPEFYHSQEEVEEALIQNRIQRPREAAAKGPEEFSETFDQIFPNSPDSPSKPAKKNPG